MSWLSAMPLLSTLAALVIIVHCAEEMERERGWNSREDPTGILDREIRDTDYEQPWRAIDAEPMNQPTTSPDAWVSSENEPKRRRFSRKRKRRPQMPDREVHKDLYQSEQRRPDIDYRDTNQALRRRRLPTLGRAEESDVAWAKRGIQNRRPSEAYDTWVEPEEFDHDRSNERQPDMKANSAEERFLDGYNRFVHRKYNSDSEPKVRPVLDKKPNDSKLQNTNVQANTDKSEFSSEVRDQSPRYDSVGRKQKAQEKINEPIPESDHLETKSTTVATHSVTIKEILKRSKGKSLSEILEQHKLSLSDLLQGKINPMTILKTIGETSKTKPSSVSNSDEGSNQKLDEVEEKLNSENIKSESIETITSESPKKIYKKINPVEIDSNANKQDGITTKNSLKNGTFVHPALLKQKKRPKQRISLSTKAPPIQVSEPNNRPNTRKHGKMSEWREVLPKILSISPPSSTEYKEDMFDEDYNKDSTNESAEKTTSRRLPTTTEADLTQEMDTGPTTIPVYTAPYNTPDYGEWVDVDNVKLVSEVPETTAETDLATEIETIEPPTTTTSTTTTSTTTTTTETPRVMPFRRPTANATALRHQVYNNRLKKKRLQHKSTSTTLPEPAFDINLQTAAEFIEKVPSTTTSKKPTQTTQSENEIDPESATVKMDAASESAVPSRGDLKHSYRKTTLKPTVTTSTTTEKTAKNEIEEILNDTRTSAKLSRILFERNMTLGELVEHRERGSSQVHLADIFHNASKEPSAAEPFLSKSLIEPISKETYPLRAILENQHDSTTRSTTVQDITVQTAYYNIPVVMDFGNNVNENGENMGIMSLFNNYTRKEIGEDVVERTYTNSDSEGAPYVSSIAVVPTNDTRNGRYMKDSWNDLFAIIKGKHKQNLTTVDVPKEEVTSASTQDNSASDSYKKTSIEEDADGDGLIILEDLQRLDPKSTMSTKAIHLESNIFHREEDSNNVMDMGVANKAASTTRSVTVATASIIGLAMVLFLLTYALLKWNQQRNIMRDKSRFGNERIATPVFEDHKELAHNNSCRSINSMMSSNIYTVDGFENSKDGNESPVYMWDELKKPFQ